MIAASTASSGSRYAPAKAFTPFLAIRGLDGMPTYPSNSYFSQTQAPNRIHIQIWKGTANRRDSPCRRFGKMGAGAAST